MGPKPEKRENGELRQENAKRAYVSFEDGVGKDSGTFAMNVVCMSGEKDEHGHYVVVPFDVTSPAHQSAHRAGAFIDALHARKANEQDMAKMSDLVALGRQLGVVTPAEAEAYQIDEGANVPAVGNA